MKLPEFQATSVDAIPGVHAKLYKTFHSQKTRPLSYRLTQLRKFYWGLKDNEEILLEACKRDLGKSHYEAYLTEVGWCMNDIIFVCKNLEKWAKEESAADMALLHMPMKPRIRKEPLGVVLVLGAYNFPLNLSLGPMIGAIAAGCTVVLKPSEQAPYAAAAMQKVVEDTLDPDSYVVLNGGIPESSALLDCKWDKIFYTGGAAVGKIVSKKAAETLTPVTLELGGRNPAIVSANADPRLAARRLLWAKHLNAGQVCMSQNYILVDKTIMPALVEEIKIALKKFYPDGAKSSPDYCNIGHDRHFQKVKKMLEGTSGKILVGGGNDPETRFFEPTVIEITDPNDSLMLDESFGPLIPIMGVDNLDEAIRIANQIDDTPLGCYPFGTKAETDKILNNTRSGGASVNDGFYHGSVPTLEFGGVGSSGTGSYRGKASFDCFTHRRAVTTTPGWVERFLDVRYPPYAGKMKQLKFATDSKPNFDREGRVKKTHLLLLVIYLGGQSVAQGLTRWAVLALTLAAFRRWSVLGLPKL